MVWYALVCSATVCFNQGQHGMGWYSGSTKLQWMSVGNAGPRVLYASVIVLVLKSEDMHATCWLCWSKKCGRYRMNDQKHCWRANKWSRNEVNELFLVVLCDMALQGPNITVPYRQELWNGVFISRTRKGLQLHVHWKAIDQISTVVVTTAKFMFGLATWQSSSSPTITISSECGTRWIMLFVHI